MVIPKLNSSVLYMEETVIPAVGTVAATLYQRFAHWCRRNESSKSKKHYKDKLWWTWDSYAGLSKDYPYWSSKVIRRACDKLRQTGLVISKRKSGNRSYWYTVISIEDWIDSEEFKNLSLIIQNQTFQIVKRRDLVLKSYAQTGTPYAQTGTSCAQTGITNTVNNTVTLPYKKEIENQKKKIQLSDEDITKADQLKITYNNLIIDDTTLTHMYDGFDSFFETIKRKAESEQEAIDTAIAGQTFLSEHPAWLRLIYICKKNLVQPYLLDVLRPRLLLEIQSNPGVAEVLQKALGDSFDFSLLDLNLPSETKYQKQLLAKLDKEISKHNRLAHN